jgi:hypothetical protein
MYKQILALMLDYNAHIKNWNIAEVYFARDDITEVKKIAQAHKIKTLASHLRGISDKIAEFGYPMSPEEHLNGFRQIKFLEENGGIRK